MICSVFHIFLANHAASSHPNLTSPPSPDLMRQLQQLDPDLLDDGEKTKNELKKFTSSFESSFNKAMTSIQRSINTLNKKIEIMDTACSERCIAHASRAYIATNPPPKQAVKRKPGAGKGPKIKHKAE